MKLVNMLFATKKKAVITCISAAAMFGVVGGGVALAEEVSEKRMEQKVEQRVEERMEKEFTAWAKGNQVGTKNTSNTNAANKNVDTVNTDFSTGSNGENPNAAQIAVTVITQEEAMAIALKDAGLTETDITLTQIKPDMEDGVPVYEIEFFAKNTEYEYEIQAENGKIRSRSIEHYNDKAYLEELREKEEEIKEREEALRKAAEALAKAEAEEADAEKQAQNGTQTENTNPAQQTTTGQENTSSKQDDQTQQTAGSYIGVDRAKQIAVAHAGFGSASEVRFSKAKLENDDGQKIYEIEFYKDQIEYEYEIHATSGTVLEWDRDCDACREDDCEHESEGKNHNR